MEKKVAVITGGSRGIGRAIALRLAQEKMDIAIIYSGNETAAQETCDEIKKQEVKTASYRCNVADYAQSKETVSQILKDFGKIDVLVNNAGITKDGLIFTMKEADYDAVMDINLKGAFHMIKHCYSHFLKRKSGNIVNISSVVGLTGNAGQANYSASKAGLIGLTKSAAKELASRRICCNAIAPGFVKTEMTGALTQEQQKAISGQIPMGEYGNPEDIAELVAFLTSGKADYITGEVIRVDGGMAM